MEINVANTIDRSRGRPKELIHSRLVAATARIWHQVQSDFPTIEEPLRQSGAIQLTVPAERAQLRLIGYPDIGGARPLNRIVVLPTRRAVDRM